MQITKIADIKNDKITALVYASPGYGKTTMLGKLKGKTLIIDVDKGSSVLAGQQGDISILRLDDDLNDLFTVLKKLEESCPFDNICIDSLSELEKSMLTVYGRLGKNDGAPELAHYNRTQFKIVDICRRFRNLPANIIFTTWESIIDYVAVDGSKYNKSIPMLSGKTSDTICGLCDVVGRLEISKDEGRFIRLEASQTIVAKDRINKRAYCKIEDLILDKKEEVNDEDKSIVKKEEVKK